LARPATKLILHVARCYNDILQRPPHFLIKLHQKSLRRWNCFFKLKGPKCFVVLKKRPAALWQVITNRLKLLLPPVSYHKTAPLIYCTRQSSAQNKYFIGSSDALSCCSIEIMNQSGKESFFYQLHQFGKFKLSREYGIYRSLYNI
jgi:hypothetical protein